MSPVRRLGPAVIAVTLLAAACGDDATTSAPSTAPTSSTTSAPSSSSTVAPSTVPPGHDCRDDAEPGATEANLDGDGLVDLVAVGWICLGTGEVFEWEVPPSDSEPVAWGSDVDADGIDEVLFFTHNEAPVTARIHELDTTAPGGLAVIVDGDGAPFEPGFSYYTGPASPSGESWFGCTDLDGSGTERLVVGSFAFDADAGDTTWTLRPVTWGDDLVARLGSPVTGSYPATPDDPAALMPGRRLCKVDEPWVPRIAQGCSADDLDPPAPPPELEGPVAATFSAIVEAAVACDFHELARIAGDITLSFGGPFDPAAFLARSEYGDPDEPLLRILVELLRMPPGRSTGGFEIWTWPGFFGEDRPATPDEQAQIEAIYDAPWDRIVDPGTGYLGHRVGIGSDGDWLYFVAGD